MDMDTHYASTRHGWDIPPQEAELRLWIVSWYQSAVTGGYIEPPYELDNATAKRLEGYFQHGLTPNEGVDICFGWLH